MTVDKKEGAMRALASLQNDMSYNERDRTLVILVGEDYAEMLRVEKLLQDAGIQPNMISNDNGEASNTRVYVRGATGLVKELVDSYGVNKQGLQTPKVVGTIDFAP